MVERRICNSYIRVRFSFSPPPKLKIINYHNLQCLQYDYEFTIIKSVDISVDV